MINSNSLKINTHGSGGMMLSPFTNVAILLKGTLLCRKHGRHGVTHTEIVQSRSSLPCTMYKICKSVVSLTKLCQDKSPLEQPLEVLHQFVTVYTGPVFVLHFLHFLK